jgi:hypothetical protein
MFSDIHDSKDWFMKKFIVLILFTLPFSLSAQTLLDIDERTLQAIDGERCLEHVQYLTDYTLEGRGTGAQGYCYAAKYVSERFLDAGLMPPPGTDSTHYQIFYVSRNFIDQRCAFAIEYDKDQWQYFKFYNDYLPFASSAPSHTTKPLVFAGYGIVSPDSQWNDYERVDVTDKIVIALNGTPQMDSLDFGRSGRSRNKLKHAENAGAAGFIHLCQKPIGGISTKRTISAVSLRQCILDSLFKTKDITAQSIIDSIKTLKAPVAVPLSNRAQITINSHYVDSLQTMNVVGLLNGRDADLKDEYIIVGAHLDHVGKLGDVIFPGANDNASGSAVITHLAEIFTRSAERPKRSILFIAFSGEEAGLLGAKYYTDHPLLPIEKTRAMINLDMVGAGDQGFMLVGGHSYPAFAELYRGYAEKLGFMEVKRRWMSKNSDHWHFYDKGIPSLFMYCMGGPPTYHSPDDTFDTLDVTTLEQVAKLNYMVIRHLADCDEILFDYIENEAE